MSFVRLLAGCYGGRKLYFEASPALRPMAHRMRAMVFNVLAHRFFFHSSPHDPFKNLRVIDVCAGTGACGFEALSRGALFVGFVENNAKVLANLLEVQRLLKAQNKTYIYKKSFFSLKHAPDAPFDLAFVDPPYGSRSWSVVLESLMRYQWLHKGSVVVVQTPGDVCLDQSPFYTVHQKRQCAQSVAWFLEYKGLQTWV